jgi:hypothetical protein
MVKNEPKIIITTCMHGRHDTVRECNKLLPPIDIYYTYSTEEDKEFLKTIRTTDTYEYENKPLSKKWNSAIRRLKDIEFDYVVLLGSDDFFDQPFLDFILQQYSKKYDLIGFKDIYFRQPLEDKDYKGQHILQVVQKTPTYVRVLVEGGKVYKISKETFKLYEKNKLKGFKPYKLLYWPGYINHRIGEPIGAGKVYSKRFLQKLDYSLFPGEVNSGLDSISWKTINTLSPNMLITSVKENNLFLCDIKDDYSMSKLSGVKNLQEVYR